MEPRLELAGQMARVAAAVAIDDQDAAPRHQGDQGSGQRLRADGLACVGGIFHDVVEAAASRHQPGRDHLGVPLRPGAGVEVLPGGAVTRQQRDLDGVPPLDEGVARQLGEQIEKTTGQRIELTASVDPEIIGGIVLRVGNSILDASIRNRLENLRKAVARGAA